MINEGHAGTVNFGWPVLIFDVDLVTTSNFSYEVRNPEFDVKSHDF